MAVVDQKQSDAELWQSVISFLWNECAEGAIVQLAMKNMATQLPLSFHLNVATEFAASISAGRQEVLHRWQPSGEALLCDFKWMKRLQILRAVSIFDFITVQIFSIQKIID